MPVSASSDWLDRLRPAGRPVADPAAVVVRGQARFTVLTARLVRCEWAATGVFEDRATLAFPNRAAPPPPWTARDDDGVLVLDTGALQIRYRLESGPFSATNLRITVTVAGQPVTWTPGQAAAGNLGGTTRTLDGAAGPVAVGPGLVSRAGWALVDDSRGVLLDADGWVVPRPGHDAQDWYFFGYGHAYTDALAEYTRFGGAIPLIPRFVLGAWWSRYWAYSAAELQALVEDFAAHDLPLDVLVVDMDWHTPESWTGYTWNRALFPDPAGFLRWVHERGLHATLNLHPAEGVQPFEEIYPRFAAALGVDPASRAPVPFQPGNPAFVRQYFELLHHPLEAQGVDFWWIDWQQGESSDLPGLDPLPWLNHLHFRDAARPDRRPLLYSRWGGLGNHRYVIGFSGDTFAVWPALAFLPQFTAQASNVLYGWWSHDIGGHFGATAPELYARWVQFGALSPCLRLHASKDPLAERRPWTFPQPVFEAARAAFRLRYQLVPYLYTMARVATDTGVALCRPLYYADPAAEGAYLARDAYFLGSEVIAAPITVPADPATGLAAVDVWLPAGTWIDYQTQESISGPGWVRLLGDLSRVPMLVRAGAILPLAPAAPTVAAIPADRLILAVFPGREGTFRLYEDDGTTPAYQEGQAEWTPITMATEETTAAATCRVQIGPTEGHCPNLPAERSYELRLEGTLRPSGVTLDGADHASWTYDAATLTTTVQVPAHDKRRPVRVAVRTATGPITALGDARNRELILADVRRLLGSAYPDLPWPELAVAVAGRDVPGRADALARLGAPFVHVYEYVALPDAAEHLGCAVVAAPADGAEFAVEATWTLLNAAGPRTETQRVAAARETQILRSPFAFSGEPAGLAWSVEVAVTWRGATWVTRHAATPLFPSVVAWRVAFYDPGAVSLTPAEAADPAAPAAAALAWQPYTPDPATLASLAGPFGVWLGDSHAAALAAGRPLAACGVTTITSPTARTVRLAVSSAGPFTLWLDGRPVAHAPAEEVPALPALPPQFRVTHMSAPVNLRAGANTLVVVSEPAAGPVHRGFGFGVTVLDAQGCLLSDLAYAAD